MHIRARLLLAVVFFSSFARAEPVPGSTVYLVQPGTGADLVTVSTTLATAEPESLMLLDSVESSLYLRTFLADWKPRRLVVIATRSGAGQDIATRIGIDPNAVLSPLEIQTRLFANAPEVIVCPNDASPELLQAACLAGVRKAPLVSIDPAGLRLAGLLDALARWRTERITLVGSAARLRPWLDGWKLTLLRDADAVQTAHRLDLARSGAIQTVVLTNPFEKLDAPDTMAALGPWLALRKRAVLRFTRADGEDASDVVARTLKEPRLTKAEYLILAGSLRSLPPELRPNPIASDRDRQIETEPSNPTEDGEPVSLAVGRLFHPDRAIVPLMQARQAALVADLKDRSPRVLIASNAGGGLPMLELFSRATIAELRNVGWSVTATLGNQVNEDEVRKQMRRHDVFLWEGHQSTLIHTWGYPRWAETTPPQLVVLQSCLALEEAKVLPILSRGAIGVVGTSTRMYSGSGGASSLAFFDSLAYEGQTLGGAMRQTKNLLIAYAQLKEQRVTDATRTGANVRAARTFTLWGDPTFRLATAPMPTVPPVSMTVARDRVSVTLPEERLPALTTPQYRATLPANGRLAGLVHPPAEKNGPREMVPLLFGEIALHAPGGDLVPRLTGTLPSSRRVFLYDARRECGTLLIAPTPSGEGFKFRVQWESPEPGER